MTNGKWRYVRASVTGTSHFSTEQKCQDFNEILLTEDLTGKEVLVITASDGAGSAKKSAEGSHIACKQFVSTVQRHFENGGTFAQINSDLLDFWITEIHEKIIENASACECLPRDFACTFLALIVGHTSAIAAQIGDGAIVVGNNGQYEYVIWPQSGEYINVTYFITDDSFISNLHVTFIDKPINEAAVFTDGIQMLALHYATKSVFEPFFRPMFEKLRNELPGESSTLSERLIDYLSSPLINDRTDDDKTLILATRQQSVV